MFLNVTTKFLFFANVSFVSQNLQKRHKNCSVVIILNFLKQKIPRIWSTPTHKCVNVQNFNLIQQIYHKNPQYLLSRVCNEVALICKRAWRFLFMVIVSLKSNKNNTILLQNFHKNDAAMSWNCYYDLKMCSISIWTVAPWWTGATPKPFKLLKSPNWLCC